MEKIKLRETLIYQEYDQAKAEMDNFFYANQEILLTLIEAEQANPNQVNKPEMLVRFAELETKMLSSLEAYKNYVQKTYDNWFEDLKTQNISIPGKVAWNSLADALIEYDNYIYGDQSKHSEEKTKEYKVKIEERRNILNLIFEIHIAEF